VIFPAHQGFLSDAIVASVAFFRNSPQYQERKRDGDRNSKPRLQCHISQCSTPQRKHVHIKHTQPRAKNKKNKKSVKAKTSYLAEMQMPQNSSLLPLPPAPPHPQFPSNSRETKEQIKSRTAFRSSQRTIEQNQIQQAQIVRRS